MSKIKVFLPITLIVLLNLIIKGFFLATNSIGGDEPFSVYHAQLDPASIINLLATGNNPPLYELFLHFWIKVFGISEFAVRFPSLLFSCITVIYLYKLGSKYFNIRVAILASLLFTFSNYQIEYAHEARVYAMFGMLTVMSMYYFLSLLNSETKVIRGLVLLLVLNLALIYSHYFGFFVLFIQFTFVLFIKELRCKYWKHLLLSIGVMAICYLPNADILINRILETSNVMWVDSPKGISDLYEMLRKFSNQPLVAVFTLLIITGSIIKYFFFMESIKIDLNKKLVMIWFTLPFFLMFFISFWVPMFLDRYLIFVAVAFSLLMAVLVDSLITIKGYRYIIPGILLLLFIVTVKPNKSSKSDARIAVAIIDELRRENTVVIFSPYHYMLNYAYYHELEIFRMTDSENIYTYLDRELEKEGVFGVNNVNEVDITNLEHVIFLDAGADFSYPNNNILPSLQDQFKLLSEHKIGEKHRVYEFQLK